jgi:hypothetical protein
MMISMVVFAAKALSSTSQEDSLLFTSRAAKTSKSEKELLKVFLVENYKDNVSRNFVAQINILPPFPACYVFENYLHIS